MTSERQAMDVVATGAHSPAAFATTDWSMVVQAGGAPTASGQAALEKLCRIYWRPLYCFARRTGVAAADAEDLTQGFFEHLLAHGSLAHADAARGHFRTFLLTSFRNFQSSERTRLASQRRGGGRVFVSLEEMQEAESQWQAEPATDESPERIYDRKWALSLFREVLAAVRREYAAVDRGALFDELEVVLWGGRKDVGYDEIAGRLGMTEGTIRVALHRLRHRFGQQLRVEVTRTVLAPEDADDEVRHLLATVSA